MEGGDEFFLAAECQAILRHDRAVQSLDLYPIDHLDGVADTTPLGVLLYLGPQFIFARFLGSLI